MNLICSLNELAEIDCREFELPGESLHRKGFVVKLGNRIVAYQNRCPHTGSPLNWQEDKFLDIFDSHIQCTVHGALFEIEGGLCIWGPCIGQSLKPIETVVIKDQLYQTAPSDNR